MLPSSSSASKLGKISVKRKEFNQAIEYFDMAVEIEDDKIKRQNICLKKLMPTEFQKIIGVQF